MCLLTMRRCVCLLYFVLIPVVVFSLRDDPGVTWVCD